MRRRRVLLVVLPAVVLAAVIVLRVNPLSGRADRDKRDGSALVDNTKELLPIKNPPATYRIMYRVENFAGGKRVVSTEELWVRRPFESRQETRAGPPKGRVTQSQAISRFGLFGTSGANSDPIVVRVAPSVASSDFRFDGVLGALVEERRLVPRERRRVLGRECEIYRTGEPVGTNRFPRASDSDWADHCIDHHGLLLEEVWSSGGRVLRRRLAVDVDENLALPAKLFKTNPLALPVDLGGNALSKLNESRSTTRWRLASVPRDFDYRGSYTFRTGTPVQPGRSVGATRESIVDVYANSKQLLVVEQGEASDPGAFARGRRTRRVRVGRLGDAIEVLEVSGTTIWARPPGTGFVRVFGTLAPLQIRRIAAMLVHRP